MPVKSTSNLFGDTFGLNAAYGQPNFQMAKSFDWLFFKVPKKIFTSPQTVKSGVFTIVIVSQKRPIFSS